MNTLAHAIPRWPVVMRSQLFFLRASGAVWLLVAACTASMAYVEVVRFSRIRELGQLSGVALLLQYRPSYPLLQVTDFLVVIACIWPLFVWRNEVWGKRDYLWSLPVARTGHDLTRLLAGATWLVVGLAACATLGLLFEHLHGSAVVHLRDGGHAHYRPGFMFWISFFVGPLIGYTLFSILPLATRRPLEWIVGAFAAFMIVAALSATFRSELMTDAIGDVFSNRFGLTTALAGGGWTDWLRFLDRLDLQRLDAGPFLRFRTANWIAALAIWTSLASAGVFLALRRGR